VGCAGGKDEESVAVRVVVRRAGTFAVLILFLVLTAWFGP
jgi:hypothetical protein